MTTGSAVTLGGETRTRGAAWMGSGPRGVYAAWAVVAAVGVTLTIALSLTGLLITVAAAGLLRLLTVGAGRERTHWDNVSDWRLWRFTLRHGLQEFTPVAGRPQDLTPRRRTRKLYNAYRDWPDGATGLYWLEDRPGRPAVAYHLLHTGAGYFTAAFAVDGPIVGLAGDMEMESAQDRFAELMAGWGSSSKLVTGLQTVTRMLPHDPADHELWLSQQLDPQVPAGLVADYVQLLAARAGRFARHYIVVRWDKDARFGTRRDDWLAVLNTELAAATSRLRDAGYRQVRALSGPQVAAVIRHMQNPGMSIDQASDATTATMFLPSHMERSHVQINDGWVHRTAQIFPGELKTMPRTGLWLQPLLAGMSDGQVTRTVSVHLQFIPARDAKRGARRDVTDDQAALAGQRRRGKLVDDTTERALSSSSARLNDLCNGSGHHGVEWAGFVTVSTPNPTGMRAAVAAVGEAADTCGIQRLDWFDTRHAAAQSLTWPLARALTPPRRPRRFTP